MLSSLKLLKVDILLAISVTAATICNKNTYINPSLCKIVKLKYVFIINLRYFKCKVN